MKIKDLYKRFPLLTMLAAFILVGLGSQVVAGANLFGSADSVATSSLLTNAALLVQGSNLPIQLMMTGASAAIAVALLYALVPHVVDPFPLSEKELKSFMSGPRSEAMGVGSYLIVVAIVGAIVYLIAGAVQGGFFSESALDSAIQAATQDAQSAQGGSLGGTASSGATLGGSAALGSATAQGASTILWDDPTAQSEVGFGLFSRLLMLILLCMTTGLCEEALCRGIVFPCAYEQAKRSGGNPVMGAALFTAVLFGVLHVTSFGGVLDLFQAGYLAGDTFALIALQTVLKFIQAALFGFVMTALFIRGKSIWLIADIHSSFNFVYLGPQVLITGNMPTSYCTGNVGDIAVLVVTIVLLLLTCAKCLPWLRSDVVSCEG